MVTHFGYRDPCVQVKVSEMETGVEPEVKVKAAETLAERAFEKK